MRPEDVREHLATQPFKPFRIFMSDGAAYYIRHPELCIIGRSAVYVVIPNPTRKWMADRLAHCALIHITRIEPLNGRNGRQPHRRGKRSE